MSIEEAKLLIKSLENKIKNLEIINKNLVKENQDKDAKIFALNKKMNELIKQNEFLSSKKRIAEIRQFIPKLEKVNNIIDEAIVPFFPRRVMKAKTGKTTVKKNKKIIFYDENVSEGKVTTKTTIVRERSRRLRDKAIEHFKIGDKIKCSICGFEFAVTYGEYGKGYIEIHHKKPVYQYDDKNIDIVLKDALDNLTPVCANCHRMLHHQRLNTSILRI